MTSAHLTQFRLLAHYNSWSNDRLYTLISSLTEAEQKRNLNAFFGSIHGTLNHLLQTDRIWLNRFASGTKYQFLALEMMREVPAFQLLSDIVYPDFVELWQQRKDIDRAIEQWMDELEPEMLSAQVRYRSIVLEVDRDHALWFGLTHFFNHQTHHRSQATTLLHQLGYDFGITDFLMMDALVDTVE